MSCRLPAEAIRRLQRARRIAVLTGAGVSAESGIPTFRDAQTGLWARYHPQELATPEAFARHPDRVWAWYAWRRSLIAQAQPNPAHLALAQMERQGPDVTLITQNIDGLHQVAGSQQVIELHGNIHYVRCAAQGHRFPAAAFPSETTAPACPVCHSRLRPDVVWFGEPLPAEALQAAWQAAQRCDVFFTIGTSAVVQPAAQLPLVALQSGALVIEINPQPTPITALVTHHLSAPAGDVLPSLVQHLWGVSG